MIYIVYVFRKFKFTDILINLNMDALVFDDIDDNQSSGIEEIDDDFFEPICSSSDMSDFEKIDLTEDNVNKGWFETFSS